MLHVFSYFIGKDYHHPSIVLGWYRNLKENYCFDINKKFIVYTDNPYLKSYEYFLDDMQVNVVRERKTIDERKRIKFDYILHFLKRSKDVSLFSFIQCNCRCTRKIHSNELIVNNKITINESCWFEKNKTPFMTLYCNIKNSVTFLKENIDGPYYQAGHFIGKAEDIIHLGEWITSNMKIDLDNHVFTKWHDETYFNFYMHKIINKEKINVVRGDQYLSGIPNYGIIRAENKNILFKNLQDITDILDQLISEIKKTVNVSKFKSCLIIGANPSLKSNKIGNIIDKSDDFIIRINKIPDKELSVFCGMKTSIFIGCQSTLRGVKEKIIVNDDTIKKISQNFIPEENKWLHTGFIAILIGLRLFDVVKIYGFGFDNKKEDNDNIQTLHNFKSGDGINHHFINFEHSLIDNMVKERKIFRMENYYVQ